MNKIGKIMLCAALIGAFAQAQAADQFVALPSYRVGPYAAGGSGFYGGAIDYFNLVNANGGVNRITAVLGEGGALELAITQWGDVSHLADMPAQPRYDQARVATAR